MSNTIIAKIRTADATAPTAGQLQVGELAFNAYDGKLYSKKQDGTVVLLSGGGTPDWASPGAIGSTTPNTGVFTTLSAAGTLTVSGAAEQTLKFYNTSGAGSTRVSLKLANRLNTDWAWIAYTDSADNGTNDLTIANYSAGSLIRINTNGCTSIGGVATFASANDRLIVQGGETVVRIRCTGASNPASLFMEPTATYDAYFGTYNNSPLKIVTNNTVRATFDTSGNLGIGTASPNSRLDVRSGVISSGYGGITVGTSGTNYSGTIRIEGTAAPGFIQNVNDAVWINKNAWYNGAWTVVDSTQPSWLMQVGTGDTIAFWRAPAASTGFAKVVEINSTQLYALQGFKVDGASSFPNSAPSAIGGLSFRNRIINGDMRIDQRNNGTAVTTHTAYPVDRFQLVFVSAGAFSAQRSTSVVPTGFTHSLGVTVTTADTSLGAGDLLGIQTIIEGSNIADLAFGSASAKKITISFWVRGSVTGTYCVAVGNSSSSGAGAPDRSYIAEYTINVANTWEYKTITIQGDTSGTWMTNNTRGLILRFTLTAGSTFQQAAGSWGATNMYGSSNQTQLQATLNATFYITGVQLEVGDAATEFERRSFGIEYVLCQRYFEKSAGANTAVGGANDQSGVVVTALTSIPNNAYYADIPFKVAKRATPNVTTYPYTTPANTSRYSNDVGTDYGANSAVAALITANNFHLLNQSGGALTVGAQQLVIGAWYASAEL